jgi:FKBP-type peptidyl-prolyl cis-trans isomerase FklB
MKQFLGIAIIIAVLFSSCAKPGAKSVKLKNESDSISYLLGIYYAKGAKMSDFKVDPKMLALAFEHVLSGDSLKFNDQEISMKLQMYYTQNQDKINKKTKEEGEKFLADNKKKPGVITLPSGLQYEVLKEGNGPMPDSSDIVFTNYTGTLIDGKVFDSSAKNGGPQRFNVTQVIPGWTEALLKMKVGSKWKLYIPSKLGYGEQRVSEDLRANSTLIFEMELLSIEPKQEEPKPDMSKFIKK